MAFLSLSLMVSKHSSTKKLTMSAPNKSSGKSFINSSRTNK